MLRSIPVQMSQFHQSLIVRRYLTQESELEASRELLNLANGITKMDKECFIAAFDEWHGKYGCVMDERSHDRRLKPETPHICAQG